MTAKQWVKNKYPNAEMVKQGTQFIIKDEGRIMGSAPKRESWAWADVMHHIKNTKK